MHRLSRQVLCPRSILRVARVQRPSGSCSRLNGVLGRHYTSSNRPIPHPDRFDRLFASLRPMMDEDQLAMTIAALIVSTKNLDNQEKLRNNISRFINANGVNKQSLDKKVNDLLENPPADNFDSFVAPLLAEGSSINTTSGEASNTITSFEELPDDPSLPHPFDQLKDHLQLPGVQRTLEALQPLERQEIMARVKSIGEAPDEMEGLIQTADLLAQYDIPIRYQRPVQPPAVQEEDTFEKEMEKYHAWVREQEEEEDDEEEDDKEFDLALERLFKEPDSRREAAFPEATKEEVVEAPKPPPRNPYPNLMVSDPLLDSRDVLELPPDKDTPFHNRVIVRNHSSIFNEALAEDGFDFGAQDYVPTKTDETEESASSIENLPFTPAEMANFYRFPLIHKRVTQQTGKGKIHRQFVLMVVGNGDGMVGLGQGKDDDASRAEAKAYAQAVRNMDWVERFEKRTIWTDMEAKLGATQLILRPRPVGFGLRCNPNLHQVLKAAGIKDISAKVWGSRNPINVIKAAFRMLQAGHAPLAMGDGVGGPGRKLNKGSGLRSKSDTERERGRQLISLRK